MGLPMSQPEPALTVYYDFAFPRFRAEIGHYYSQEDAGDFCMLDATRDLPPGVRRELALARIYGRLSNGRCATGTHGSVDFWKTLPRRLWAVQFASLSGAIPRLELAHRLFHPIRPWLSKAYERSNS
jgi:hypothetical protein